MPNPLRPAARLLRVAAAILLGLGALFFIFLVAGNEQIIRGDTFRNDRDQNHFQSTDYYVRGVESHTGHLPSARELRDWTMQMGFGPYNIDQCPVRDFRKNDGDRFVLSFERDGQAECYASPSGKTTLPSAAETRSSMTLRTGFWLLAAVILAFLAWGAYPRIKPPEAGQAASSS